MPGYRRLLRTALLILCAVSVCALPLAAQEGAQAPALSPQEQELARLYNEGSQAYNRSDYAAAEKAWLGALEVAQALKNDLRTARTLNALGALTERTGRYEKALDYHARALELFEKVNSTKDIASSLNNRANAYFSMGRYDKAMEFHERARPFYEQQNDPLSIATSFNNRGNVYWALGQFEEARALHEKALALREQAGKEAEISDSLNNLGTVFHHTGQLDKALDHFDRALAIRIKLNNPWFIARTLSNLGSVYMSLGQSDRAQDYYARALDHFEKTGIRQAAAMTLYNLADVFSQAGQYDRAEQQLSRALAMFEAAGSPQQIALCRNHLGGIYRQKGQLTTALEFHRGALKVLEGLPVSYERFRCLNSLGLVYERMRQYEAAADWYARALVQAEQLGNPLWAAGIQGNLGGIYEAQGQGDRAKDAYDRAIRNLEAVSEQVGDPAQVGAFQLAHQPGVYARYAALLVRRKRFADALEMVERGRARGLARQAAQSRADFAALFSREEARQWQAATADYVRSERLLSAARRRHEQAISEEKRAAETQLSECRQAFEGAERRLVTLRADLYRRHPEFRRLGGAESPSFAHLKALAERSPETLFLEWAVVDDDTMLFFALSKKAGLQAFMLPTGEKALLRLVTQWRTHLTALADRRKDKAAAVAGEEKAAKALYRVLFDPLTKAGLLGPGRFRRLVVVSDGPLSDAPFAALMDDRGRRLIESYPLSAAVSLGVLTWPAGPRRPTAGLLCFADPTGERGEVVRSATRGDFGALPAARKETKALMERFPGALGRFGKEAQEQAFKGLAGKHALLHCATHGQYDRRDGMRSFLVLAPGEGEDGFLEAREIVGLRLSAQLVTLSACHTAQGQPSGGDGLLGLAWAFRAAGCPSVVASQWQADDAATGRLMTRFYEELKKGRRKDDALRAAMLLVQREPFHSPPYFWAAFQVIGETGSLSPPP